MKLITAIINKHDAGRVCKALSENGFEFTKLATTGGFLRMGNTTLVMGVEDEKFMPALDIMKHNCAQRKEKVPSIMYTGTSAPIFDASNTAEVTVGGAVVFVTDITYYEKM